MGVSQIGFPQNTVYKQRIQTSETLPVTLQASKYGIFSFDISAGDGITPLGIVGWGCNETSQTFIHEYYMNENGQTAELYLKNPYSTGVSITSLWIDVLYTKIGLDMSEVTVIDNLTTDSGLDALSARQGKVLNDKLSAIGSYSTATGTYTTATWARGTNTCTWTAPSDGIYLVWMFFQLQDASSAIRVKYKQLQMIGSATRLLANMLYWDSTATENPFTARTISQPVRAYQGQDIIPYVHTDGAGIVFNVYIIAVKIAELS